jgi:putative transcriptional regulator
MKPGLVRRRAAAYTGLMLEAMQNQADWLTGQLLIAMPAMRDPRFIQSVIFICAHNAEGAMGVVLNRPVKAPKFPELLQQLGVEPHPPRRELAVGTGGPVDDKRGFVLHSPDWTADGSLEIDDLHMLSANLDILRAVAAGGGPEKARLVLGYAGWGAGQLDEEMMQNAWLNVPADESIIYDTDYTTKWQRALAKLHIDPAHLSPGAGRA